MLSQAGCSLAHSPCMQASPPHHLCDLHVHACTTSLRCTPLKTLPHPHAHTQRAHTNTRTHIQCDACMQAYHIRGTSKSCTHTAPIHTACALHTAHCTHTAHDTLHPHCTHTHCLRTPKDTRCKYRLTRSCTHTCISMYNCTHSTRAFRIIRVITMCTITVTMRAHTHTHTACSHVYACTHRRTTSFHIIHEISIHMQACTHVHAHMFTHTCACTHVHAHTGVPHHPGDLHAQFQGGGGE